jgi:hypothetical protein
LVETYVTFNVETYANWNLPLMYPVGAILLFY